MRGEVIAIGSGAPVAFATVELRPLFGPRFADAAGRFAFAPVPPGQYRLRVRQIGHVPYDATLVVGDSGLNIQIGLQPLFILLPPVNVAGRAACTAPGAPDPAREPELAALFAELRENADRFRVLSDEYPFRYWVEHVYEQVDSAGAVSPMGADTVEYSSQTRTGYAPGRVVRLEPEPGGGYRHFMPLPTLADLADSVFHRTHCFRFAGVETVAGRPFLHVTFRAADRLRTPDVDGSALIDSTTRVLYRLDLSLTRPERAARVRGITVETVTAEAIFGELVPTLVVPAQIHGVTKLRVGVGARRKPPLRLLEWQRILRVEFIGAAPPGSEWPR